MIVKKKLNNKCQKSRLGFHECSSNIIWESLNNCNLLIFSKGTQCSGDFIMHFIMHAFCLQDCEKSWVQPGTIYIFIIET